MMLCLPLFLKKNNDAFACTLKEKELLLRHNNKKTELTYLAPKSNYL